MRLLWVRHCESSPRRMSRVVSQLPLRWLRPSRMARLRMS
nr:MAG TPA: hypothetical protein [Caudoviricetes sp.]